MRYKTKMKIIKCLLISFLFTACANDASNPKPKRPHIILEPFSEFGIPLIPFPSNTLTVKDNSSPTGLRLYLSQFVSTELERKEIRFINSLDGFSTIAPIFISFSDDVSLPTVKSSIPVDSNDSVFLVRFQEIVIDSSGKPICRDLDKPELIPFDLGRGFYPLKRKPIEIFPLDPKSDMDNLIFSKNITETNQEFYEIETKTLILRPVVPLKEKSNYAVIITKRLKSTDDKSFNSPFDKPYFPSQKEYLPKILKLLNISESDITFFWVFTTKSNSEIEQSVRNALSDDFVPKIREIYDLSPVDDEDNNNYILSMEGIGKLIELILTDIEKLLNGNSTDIASTSPISGQTLIKIPTDIDRKLLSLSLKNIKDFLSFKSVDYIVFGDFKTFDGEIVPFLVSIPKKDKCSNTNANMPPFPVSLIGHGYSGSKLHSLIFAEYLARNCIAAFGIDAPFHGPEGFLAVLNSENPKTFFDFSETKESDVLSLSNFILKQFIPFYEQKLLSEGLKFSLNIKPSNFTTFSELREQLIENGFIRAILTGRSQDYDDDGVQDSGAFFFTSDMVATRNLIERYVLDFIYAQKLIDSLSGDGIYGGDFNLDGIKDIKTLDEKYEIRTKRIGKIFYAGVSMGGIMGSVLAGANPSVKRAVVNVPGGGIVDILPQTNLQPRTSLGFNPLLSSLFGFTISGKKEKAGGEDKYLITPSDTPRTQNMMNYPFSFLKDIEDMPSKGDVVVLKNLSTGDEKETTVDDNEGFFALSIPANPQDLLNLSIKNKRNSILLNVPFHFSGVGAERNTPRLRFLISLSQLILDSVDPANLAKRWNSNNTSEPRVLVQISACDNIVPVSTGFTLARGADYISYENLWNIIKQRKVLSLEDFENFEAKYPEVFTSGLPFSVYYCNNELGHGSIGIVTYFEDWNFNGELDNGEDENKNSILDMSLSSFVQEQLSTFLSSGRIVKLYFDGKLNKEKYKEIVKELDLKP